MMLDMLRKFVVEFETLVYEKTGKLPTQVLLVLPLAAVHAMYREADERYLYPKLDTRTGILVLQDSHTMIVIQGVR